nr:thioesterase [uncultured bacterium]
MTGPLVLYCLPWAGGGASAFRAWPAAFGPGTEVRPIQLPGREDRLDDEPHRRMSTLIAELGPRLAAEGPSSFAVFGHSMGALVAYELVSHLEAGGRPAPAVLFLSGHGAPGASCAHTTGDGDMSDDTLVERILALGGTDPVVFRHPELRQMALRTLRADLELCCSYRPARPEPVNTPVVVYGGVDDHWSHASLAGWADHTTAPVRLRWFPGGHFFPVHALDDLVDDIRRVLLGHQVPS